MTNYFWESLPADAEVIEHQTHFTAIVNGVEGLVCWDSRHAALAQRSLKERAVARLDKKAKEQGFLFKATVEGVPTPFYFRNVDDVGAFLREQYPNSRLGRPKKL